MRHPATTNDPLDKALIGCHKTPHMGRKQGIRVRIPR